jgi:hypothetical protein
LDAGQPQPGLLGGGKIHRIAPDGSGHAEIPFQVADSRDVIDPPRRR